MDPLITEPTKADFGLAVHEALHVLYQEAIQGKPLDKINTIRKIFDKAIQDNINATDIRVGTPKVTNTVIDEDRASLVAFTIKNTQAYLRSKFRSNDFTIFIPNPRKKMRNIVDWQTYDHLATVIHDNIEYVFGANSQEGYILSEKQYWEEVQETN